MPLSDALSHAKDHRKSIATIVTAYHAQSHAQNIVDKFLEGYLMHWVHVPPRVRVASLYTDQVPADDISRDMAAKHNLPIYPTIHDALTLGGAHLAVDGVVLLGEHGDYPVNEKGQHMYPRRRFFEETVKVFRESGRVVPVFNDKHLSYNWDDAKWIYDTAKALGIPMMAGSSMPVSFRSPPLNVPLGTPIEEMVVVAEGPIEAYGYHALEIAQCLAERRNGFETGVRSVQYLTGATFWDAWESKGHWSPDLYEAALAVIGHAEGTAREYFDHLPTGDEAVRQSELAQPQPFLRHLPGPRRPPGVTTHGPIPTSNGPSPEWAAFLIEYRDGLRLTVLMLGGYVLRRAVALRIAGQTQPWASWFLQQRRRSQLWHFDNQVDLIERMVENGQSPIPLERTLLTTGMIDAVMTSRFEQGKLLETPHLAVTYQPNEVSVQLSDFQY